MAAREPDFLHHLLGDNQCPLRGRLCSPGQKGRAVLIKGERMCKEPYVSRHLLIQQPEISAHGKLQCPSEWLQYGTAHYDGIKNPHERNRYKIPKTISIGEVIHL